jgi:hypothetical protein
VTFSNNITKLGLEYAIYSFLNGFGDSKERNAVRMIVDNTYKANIANDFGIAVDLKLNDDEVSPFQTGLLNA